MTWNGSISLLILKWRAQSYQKTAAHWGNIQFLWDLNIRIQSTVYHQLLSQTPGVKFAYSTSIVPELNFFQCDPKWIVSVLDSLAVLPGRWRSPGCSSCWAMRVSSRGFLSDLKISVCGWLSRALRLKMIPASRRKLVGNTVFTVFSVCRIQIRHSNILTALILWSNFSCWRSRHILTDVTHSRLYFQLKLY